MRKLAKNIENIIFALKKQVNLDIHFIYDVINQRIKAFVCGCFCYLISIIVTRF